MIRTVQLKLFVAMVLAISSSSCAQSGSDAADVRRVLEEQTAAWNKGDLPAFVDGYDNDAVFVGAEVTRGKAGVLDRYKKTYGTPEKRGKLEFSALEVRPLGTGYASVIGRFYLTRTPEGGGDARGIFSLLFQKREGAWKIILDHTS